MKILACSMVVAMAAGVAAAQQRRPERLEKPTVPMEVTLQIGKTRLVSSAPGRCEFAEIASIYDVKASMWHVEQGSGSQSLNLTMWNPKDASEQMFSVYASAGDPQQARIIRGQSPAGSGTIQLQPAPKGGTFRVDIKSDKGVPITGTIKCAAFTAAMAEGGN